jgi:outer membrane protein assembly factor BamB
MIRQLSFALIFVCLHVGPVALLSQDWPEIRGEKGVGSFSPGGVLAGDEAVELKVAWKKKIGSGYSSVVVADGRVIAMYSDGDEDVVACLDSESGEETWKKTIGPRFIGKNGSFDGPISTPVIRDDCVFVLTPTGRLIASIWRTVRKSGLASSKKPIRRTCLCTVSLRRLSFSRIR